MDLKFLGSGMSESDIQDLRRLFAHNESNALLRLVNVLYNKAGKDVDKAIDDGAELVEINKAKGKKDAYKELYFWLTNTYKDIRDARSSNPGTYTGR